MTSCKKQIGKPQGYHFTECGLDYVYLINGYEVETDDVFGESTRIFNADKLHREIARSVLLHKQKLEGQEVRFLRSLLRLTQEQLGELLGGITRETVSRWESNRNPIDDSADMLLRVVVWEEYLDEQKARQFFDLHKKNRTHYKLLNMQESKNNWQVKLAA